ncbi:LuxR family transcriptional regulator [Marinobacter salarius]|uniref:helix-turn-helix transcriptional regulator n=1 Tax=Marinobacter salarius TaxID=1420917 RepID=UPI001BD15146|nr:LuxR C-terminal-related transcriptional regulator [Marinobacter salarius]MBS8230280.1 LuxR family transcriptional regulator [Marinobacter salarius]
MLAGIELVDQTSTKSPHLNVNELIRKICENEIIGSATFYMMCGAYNSYYPFPYIKTTHSPEWISSYFVNSLMKVDPILRFARTAENSFLWSDIALTSAEEKMMEHALGFGGGATGFSVPTFGTGGYRGLFSLCPVNEFVSDWPKHIAKNRKGIENFASNLHLLAQREIDPNGEYSTNLSRREIECLKLIAIGKTYTEIATILDISANTVRSYVRELRLKLNSTTLAQAVARGCVMGLV